MSAGATHCPHCGATLPTEDAPPGEPQADLGEGGANFCPSCGRRIAGWTTGTRAALGGAGVGGVALPGAEEPTRAMQPTESLLRAVAKSKAGVKPPNTNWRAAVPLLAGLGLFLAGGGLVFLLLRPKVATRAVPAPLPPAAPLDSAKVVAAPPEPPRVAAPEKNAPRPQHIVAPPIAAHPVATAPPIAPAKPLVPPPKVFVTPAKSSAKVVQTGPLPHKVSKVDSRSAITPAALSGTSPPLVGAPSAEPPRAPNETTEAAPQTPDERRSEEAARVDADGVRFVVRAHLPQVQACYGRSFKESSPGGRVDIGFVIGQNGRASKIRTERNTTNAPALGKCLEQRIAEWEFARPASGEFELVYPFVFSQGS